MDMTSKACQVGFFRDHDHPVGFTHCGSYGFLIERGERAQVDNLNGPAFAVHNVGGSGAGFQYHRAPTNDGNAAWPLTNAQAASFTYRQCIVAIGDIPVPGYSRNDV